MNLNAKLAALRDALETAQIRPCNSISSQLDEARHFAPNAMAVAQAMDDIWCALLDDAADRLGITVPSYVRSINHDACHDDIAPIFEVFADRHQEEAV